MERYYSNALRQPWIICEPPQNQIRNGMDMAKPQDEQNHTIIILSILSFYWVDVLIPWREWRIEWSDEQSVTCTEPAKIAAVNVNINVSGGEHGKKARGERLRLRENAFNGFSNPKTFSRNDEENEICIKLNQLNESAVYFFSSLVASIAPLTIWRWRYSFHSNYGNDANLRTRIAANPE